MSKASYRAGRDGSYRYFTSPFSLFSAFSVSSEHGKAIFPATGHCKAKKGGVAKPRWVGWPSQEGPGGQAKKGQAVMVTLSWWDFSVVIPNVS